MCTPLLLAVADNRPTIKGKGMDAAAIRSYIKSFTDDRAYAVGHIGCGTKERAYWHHMANTRELEAELGMNALAFPAGRSC